MKKIISLALCLMFCLFAFAGCSSLKEEEKGANIHVYLSSFPHSLDPALAPLTSNTDQLLSLIFEPLTRIDKNGKVVGALAEEWYYKYDDIWNEHKMYFKLKDTMWSDKRPVSADDVIYAWRRILDPSVESPYASLLYPIKNAKRVKSGIDTIDSLGLAASNSNLLEITFESEYDIELFAETVANVHLAPEREDIITRSEKENLDKKESEKEYWAENAGTIVCNGPFRVQAMNMLATDEMDPTKAYKLVFERNSYYERDDDDALDKYVLPHRITCLYYEGQKEFYDKHLTQEQFQKDRFLKNEIYYINGFDKETYEFFKNNKDYKMKTNDTTNGFAFYFNNKNDILSDANVRKALSVALDRNKIVNEITGTGEIAATGYVPHKVFNTDRKTDFRDVGGNLYSTEADINLAKDLISKSGKSKGTLTISYLIPQTRQAERMNGKIVNYDNNVFQKIAEYAKSVWESLGYKIELKGLYPKDYTKAIQARDYDIIGTNIMESSVSAFDYLAPFATEYSGASVSIDLNAETFSPHYTNFENSDYNALIDKAVYCKDRQERADILHEAEKLLAEQSPATMLFWYTNNYVASKKISGYKMDSWFGYMDFSDLKLKDWRDVNASEDAMYDGRADDTKQSVIEK